MKTTEVKEFKKQFLYREERVLNAYLSNYERYIFLLNELIEESEKLLQRKLSSKEKTIIKETDKDIVLESLRKTYQFKGATDEFNCQALGVSLSGYVEAEGKFRVQRGTYDAALSNNVFVSMNEVIESIEERSTTYTKNEKQNIALELGNKLEKLLEEMEKHELVNKYGRHFMFNVVNYMKVGSFGKFDHRIRVNKEFLSSQI